MKDKVTKRTVDVPDDIYHMVMKYGSENKIYKFGPALIDIIKKFLENK